MRTQAHLSLACYLLCGRLSGSDIDQADFQFWKKLISLSANIRVLWELWIFFYSQPEWGLLTASCSCYHSNKLSQTNLWRGCVSLTSLKAADTALSTIPDGGFRSLDGINNLIIQSSITVHLSVKSCSLVLTQNSDKIQQPAGVVQDLSASCLVWYVWEKSHDSQ